MLLGAVTLDFTNELKAHLKGTGWQVTPLAAQFATMYNNKGIIDSYPHLIHAIGRSFIEVTPNTNLNATEHFINNSSHDSNIAFILVKAPRQSLRVLSLRLVKHSSRLKINYWIANGFQQAEYISTMFKGSTWPQLVNDTNTLYRLSRILRVSRENKKSPYRCCDDTFELTTLSYQALLKTIKSLLTRSFEYETRHGTSHTVALSVHRTLAIDLDGKTFICDPSWTGMI